jgi:hypothetical protein
MQIPGLRFPRLVTCAIALGSALACQQAQPTPAQAAPAADAAAKELAAMKADIQMLKDKAPSASVAMADVSFHWSKAGEAGEAAEVVEATNRIRVQLSGTTRDPAL